MAPDLDTSTEAATRDPSDFTTAGAHHKASGGRPVAGKLRRSLTTGMDRDGRGLANFFTVAASLAAIIYAAQGMIGFATDIINTPAHIAWFIACFLELALVATALRDRVAAIEGRSSKGISTWVVSAVSGCLSALHEIVKSTPDGGSRIVTEPSNILAALFRIAAPLVAAYLIHRLLVSDMHAANGMTELQQKRDKRLHRLARATIDHARAEAALEKSKTWQTKRREAVAHKRKDRRYDHLLKVYAATEPNFHDDIDKWLRALGAADMFTKRTDLEADAPSLAQATAIPTTTRRPSARRTSSTPAQPKPTPAVAASASPAPKEVAAASQPTNVRALPAASEVRVTAQGRKLLKNQEAAYDMFVEMLKADPGMKPDAAEIHRQLGLEVHQGTSRKWIAQWQADVDTERRAAAEQGNSETDQAALEA